MVDIGELIQGILFFFSDWVERRQAKIVVDIPDNTQIYVDRQQIQQVLINILSNAMDATSCTFLPVIYISCERKKDSICLLIADNGEGIREADIGKVFDPFYTTKTSGTGLGLAISHQLVKRTMGKFGLKAISKKAREFSSRYRVRWDIAKEGALILELPLTCMYDYSSKDMFIILARTC
jgi:polar amino acid transport system substrate-binding protein